MINTTFDWQKDLGQPWQAISKSLPTPIAALGQFFADIDGFKKEEPVGKKPEEALIQDKTSFVKPSIAQLKTQPGIRSEQAVNVTKIAEAALLSSQKGTPIYLDLR